MFTVPTISVVDTLDELQIRLKEVQELCLEEMTPEDKEWLGKTVLRIGQFEPSSKLCSTCGYHNKELQLSDRYWECPECDTKHDRDINAASNIKKFALIDQNLIGL